MKKIFLLVAFFYASIVFCQNDSIVKLKEVVLIDTKLKAFSLTHSIVKLSDSVIQRNPTSLTELLRNNTTIYFKEYGKGMTSSASFRGTTSQQTAVLWNGININSQFNGQTDFNTINSFDFNSIAVRAGGGSVAYGSGAIGGTIHLNSYLDFEDKFSNTVRLNYGSYATKGIHYKLNLGSDKISANINFSRNQSENDYEYLGYNKKNENGSYENTSFNTLFGYKINNKNTIKFATHLFDGEKFFSGTIASPSRSKYEDYNARNLLEWKYEGKSFISSSQVAYLTEKYKYFENKESDLFSYGEVKSLILKYDFFYKISDKIKINPIISHTQNTGIGTNVSKTKRNISSLSLLFKHSLLKKVNYEIGFRKEITSNYESPLLYSIGVKYSPFKFYNVKANFSKNFRIPTFNDLYWEGSGNTDLNPEHSLQYEINNIFNYKDFEVRLTGFKTDLKDMLRWVPNEFGIWRPENTDLVNIYGFEANLNWKRKIQNIRIDLNGNYAYTKSTNEITEKQLIYVPYHKFTSSLAVNVASFSLNYQYVFNGEVFTSSDNFYKLKEYGISNLSIDYTLKTKIKTALTFQVFNVENKPYQNLLSRPMPGRNYTMNLTLNF
ncbi:MULTISPECIES: TonB-dependent receptor plug domain-containing protein [Flavobacterium]|uniref:TonB-dependent receptor plug domain-containing protein n=2 Tax=Flavobacterium TaxID=237 RepID=A0ABV5GSH5_9FLAO|nr:MULTISPECIES: TonB-dependent receptor [Flavobacterium]